jgi:16S rRNA C1402 (ribose-2'-O) methylase RsmI
LILIDIDSSGRLIQFNRNAKDHDRLVDLVRTGSSAAFVVGQGTPCIGDEGSVLVRDMLAGGIRVTAVPGVDACTTALTMSGADMAADGGSYRFGGYLPTKRGQRVGELRVAAAVTYPSVYFEAASRLLETLGDIAAIAPNRRVSIIHEATKVHEATHTDKVEALIRYYHRSSMTRSLSQGQLVVVVNGRLPEAGHDAALAETLSRSDTRSMLAGVTAHVATVANPAGLTLGVDGSDAGGSVADAGRTASTLDAAMLEQAFVHFCVLKHMAEPGMPEAAAIRATAAALRMPEGKVARLFKEEDAIAAAEEAELGGHYEEAEQLEGVEKEIGEEPTGTAPAAEMTRRSSGSAVAPAAASGNLVLRAEQSLGQHHYADADVALQEMPRRRRNESLDREAAEQFLRLRSQLRSNGVADEVRHAALQMQQASARGQGMASHVPGDWTPCQDDASAVSEREHVPVVQAAYDADSGVSKNADASNTKPEVTSTAQPTKLRKAPKRKGAKRLKASLRERLRLQRLVHEKREHVRLLQLGLTARAAAEKQVAAPPRRAGGSFGTPYQPR